MPTSSPTGSPLGSPLIPFMQAVSMAPDPLLLSILSTDLSADSHTVTFPDANSVHYVKVNDGTAGNHILWEAPAGARLRGGLLPNYNELDGSSEDNTTGVAGGRSAGSSETATTITLDTTSDYWARLSPKIYNTGDVVNLRVILEETGSGSIVNVRLNNSGNGNNQDKKQIDLSGAGQVEVSLTVTMTSANKVEFGIDARSIIIAGADAGTFTYTECSVQNLAGFADQSPREYVPAGVGGVDPTSEIDGLRWEKFLPDDTTVTSGVVTRTGTRTAIAAADIWGDLMEGVGGNLQPEPHDLTQSNWIKRGSCTASVSSSRDTRIAGAKVSKIEALGLSGEDVFDSRVGGTANATISQSFYLSRTPAETGTLVCGNPQGGTLGKWNIDLSLVSDTVMERITKAHPAVTELTAFANNASGNGGTIFSMDTGTIGTRTIYINGIMEEESDVSTSFTELSSRTATNSASVVLTDFGFPDTSDGAMEFSIYFNHDWADFPALNRSVISVKGGASAELCYQRNVHSSSQKFASFDGSIENTQLTTQGIKDTKFTIKIYWELGGNFNLSVNGVKSVATAWDGNWNALTLLELLKGYTHGAHIGDIKVYGDTQGGEVWLIAA